MRLHRPFAAFLCFDVACAAALPVAAGEVTVESPRPAISLPVALPAVPALPSACATAQAAAGDGASLEPNALIPFAALAKPDRAEGREEAVLDAGFDHSAAAFPPRTPPLAGQSSPTPLSMPRKAAAATRHPAPLEYWDVNLDDKFENLPLSFKTAFVAEIGLVAGGLFGGAVQWLKPRYFFTDYAYAHWQDAFFKFHLYKVLFTIDVNLFLGCAYLGATVGALFMAFPSLRFWSRKKNSP